MLNAVVMNSYARARAEAKALDAKAARGDFAGPLHGVPMTIKDSLDTEGVITTGATYGRQQYVPTKDATVVARVRKAGAILLGKTNTPEFTLGGLGGISTASNLLYGSSHNPYDLTRSTAGSSGGAGAIVAAGGAAFDIGSDWGGSIRGPSHNNGIAGIKPTSVRVPRTGHIVDYGGIFDLWQQLGPDDAPRRGSRADHADHQRPGLSRCVVRARAVGRSGEGRSEETARRLLRRQRRDGRTATRRGHEEDRARRRRSGCKAPRRA